MVLYHGAMQQTWELLLECLIEIISQTTRLREKCMWVAAKNVCIIMEMFDSSEK